MPITVITVMDNSRITKKSLILDDENTSLCPSVEGRVKRLVLHCIRPIPFRFQECVCQIKNRSKIGFGDE